MMRWTAIIAMSLFATLSAGPNDDQNMTPQPKMDCSSMAPDMQQFAGKLSVSNKAMFCGKFSDAQRAQAMQMASQMDPSGKPMMTGDQSVQKIAADSGMAPMKTPSGCPVK